MSEERKVGENFDASEANSIFDKLKNVEGKVKSKREGKFDNFTHLMQEAQILEKENKLDEAAQLYKEVIFALPDSTKAYEALINIYQKQGDVESIFMQTGEENGKSHHPGDEQDCSHQSLTVFLHLLPSTE